MLFDLEICFDFFNNLTFYRNGTGRRRSGSLDSRSSTPLSDRGDKDYRDFRIPPPGHVDTRPARPRCRDYDGKQGSCGSWNVLEFEYVI